MTDAEFLDDIERRGINGDIFTAEETLRLWRLAGARIPPHEVRVTYMRGRARQMVSDIRKHLKSIAIKRIKEAG